MKKFLFDFLLLKKVKVKFRLNKNKKTKNLLIKTKVYLI